METNDKPSVIRFDATTGEFIECTPAEAAKRVKEIHSENSEEGEYSKTATLTMAIYRLLPSIVKSVEDEFKKMGLDDKLAEISTVNVLIALMALSSTNANLMQASIVEKGCPPEEAHDILEGAMGLADVVARAVFKALRTASSMKPSVH